MCGLWASVGVPRDDRVLDPIKRRGPDDARIEVLETPAGPLVLGFRRLAIYDLSSDANQPLSWSQASGAPALTIIFNGAIYNHVALREELCAQGFRFRTRSDTEVVLAAWSAWGPEALHRFEGMFAFVLYDAARQRLTIARDRFGEKPLHYARVRIDGREGWAFASDVRQLTPRLADPARLATDVAGAFLNFGQVDRSDATFFAQIHRAPAASLAHIDLSGPIGEPTFTRWWTPEATDRTLDYAATCGQLRESFERAVSLRLTADVPVGSCLSGGLDSTAIVRAAVPILSARGFDPLTTITAIYDTDDASGASLSERPYFDAAVHDVALHPHVISPSSDDILAATDQVIDAQGEPFAHSSVVLQWFVFRAARDHGMKVMLDGQGADELFAGYPHMITHHLADVLARGRIGQWRALAESFDEGGGGVTAATLRSNSVRLLVDQRVRVRIAQARGRWPGPYCVAPSEAHFEPHQRSGAARTRFDKHVLDMVEADSLPALLRYEDRNAMDHAIESRLPFLANAVSDIAFRAPVTHTLRDGWTKAIIRDAVEEFVPDIITRRRRKLGFVTPQDVWMAGPWRDWTVAAIEQAQRRFPEWLSRSACDRVVAAMGRDAAASAAAYRLAIFARWAERFGVG